MRCVLCEAPLLTATWRLFLKTTQPCQTCLDQFERVVHQENKLMQRERQTHGRGFRLIRSLYTYNQAAADFMLRYKYSGDWVLSTCFSRELRMLVRQSKGITIVPIPLSDHSHRGFAQVEALLGAAKIHYVSLLRTKEQQPQATKTRAERLSAPPSFTLKKEANLKKVVLFDDVSTTGATLYAASRCLEEAGVEVCGAYVLFSVQEKAIIHV